MFFSIVVLIVSTALFLFYLQATCERILGRQFEQQYFWSVASAYHLEFASLQQASLPAAAVPTRLRVDFLRLTTLLKDAKFKGCRSYREGLLTLYFRTLLWLFAAGQALGVGERRVLDKLTVILQYFANLVGESDNALRRGPLTPAEYLVRI